MFDSTDLGISWDTGLMIDAIWLVILMHILSDKISIVLPEIQPSETSWPLWTHTSSHAHLCCTNPYAHMHTRMHMSIHNFLGLYCVWRKGLPLFLPGKQSSNSELPISSHSHAKKKKIPNAVKRKLGIIVYDRNVNFVKKKKNVGFTRCFWSWLPNPFALSTAASPLSDPTPPPMCCLYQSEPNWCLLQALNFRQIK